jgi:O-antigen biosynthesis protein
MAYRRTTLERVGGFDPQFRAAGDDVDICWRLQEAGETLRFHPAAVVWHSRRGSLRAYWRQQVGYGHAEALLERKWPERYNRHGHPTWAGRLYGRASARFLRPVRIYHGVWGAGAYQPEEAPPQSQVAALLASPDWYLALATLTGASLLTPLLPALVWLGRITAIAAAATVIHAVGAALHQDLPHVRGRGRRLWAVGLTALLHLIQPAARLTGRLANGLAPWRRNRGVAVALPVRRLRSRWHEAWLHPQERVRWIEDGIKRAGGRVVRGGPYDRWDLEVLAGIAGTARMLIVVEEHGRGRQLVRCRVWPRTTRNARLLAAVLAAATAAAAAAHLWSGVAVAGGGLGILCATLVAECGHAVAAGLAAFDVELPDEPAPADEPTEAPSRARPTASIAMEEV